MAERSQDWMRQAESDLRHARHARDDADFDWAAFASHQAAEKAINIPTRYPNGFERGAPIDFYTRADADRTIAAAEAILEFCQDQIGRHRTDSGGR